MRYGADDDQLTGIGGDEGRAERFLAGLRRERQTFATWAAEYRSGGPEPVDVGDTLPDDDTHPKAGGSWGVPRSGQLVRRRAATLERAGQRPMLVGDVMHGPVASVVSTTALSEVVALMNGLRVPWVVVEALIAARDGEVVRWHVISDVDLLRATTAAGPIRTAGSIATIPPLCVDVRDDLASASAALLEHGRSCAMVVEDGLPAGLVSACDIAAVWAA